MLLLDIVEQVFRFDKVVTFEALPLILSVLAWKRKNILKMHYFARFQSARALDQGGSCNIFALGYLEGCCKRVERKVLLCPLESSRSRCGKPSINLSNPRTNLSW